jgi:hypothetical protein
MSTNITSAVKATVTAPDNIEIPLVRGDHHEMRNIFRIFFEIFLAVTAMWGGVVFSNGNPSQLRYISLGFLLIITITFLLISIFYKKGFKIWGKKQTV